MNKSHLPAIVWSVALCILIEGCKRTFNETVHAPSANEEQCHEVVLESLIEEMEFKKTPFPEVLARLSAAKIRTGNSDAIAFIFESENETPSSANGIGEIDSVTLKCKNIPLYTLLDMIAQLTGTSYRHECGRIIFSLNQRDSAGNVNGPAEKGALRALAESESSLICRQWNLVIPDCASWISDTEIAENAKTVLSNAGVYWPAGSEIRVLKNENTVFVRNTKENLALIASVLEKQK